MLANMLLDKYLEVKLMKDKPLNSLTEEEKMGYLIGWLDCANYVLESEGKKWDSITNQ